MNKSAEAFRTITEVADLLQTPSHVLRFWEGKFPQVKPVKRAGGRRYYRPADVALLAGIKHLLHEDGLTIRGVQKMIKEQGVRVVTALGTPELSEEGAAPAEPAESLPEALPEAMEAPLSAEEATADAAPEAAAEPLAEPADASFEAEQQALPEASPEVIPDSAEADIVAPAESLEALAVEAPEAAPAAEAALAEPAAEAAESEPLETVAAEAPAEAEPPGETPTEARAEAATEAAETIAPMATEETVEETAAEPEMLADETSGAPVETEAMPASAPEADETAPADPAYAFIAPHGPARLPVEPPAETAEADAQEPAAPPRRSGWQQGSLFDLLVVETKPAEATPEPAPEAEADPADSVPEAPMALDVEPEPDPLARVVSLIIGGTSPVSAALAEAEQIDPERDRLRALRDRLPVLLGAKLSPIERMRLMSARDRLVALKARLAQPPRKPKP